MRLHSQKYLLRKRDFMKESEVKKAVLKWLYRNGWSYAPKIKDLSEHGADIIVRHKNYPRYFVVECKGDPEKTRKERYKHGLRNVYFLTALGQIITRMKPKAMYWYGIAFPESYYSLLKKLPKPLRRRLRLKVFFVSKEGKVTVE